MHHRPRFTRPSGDIPRGVVVPVDTRPEADRTRWLFAVADYDADHARLGAPDVADPAQRALAIRARAASITDAVAALDRGVYVRAHRADFERARLWLALAARWSAAAIDAATPAEQTTQAVATWRAFGNACRALNLRPQTITAFRRACERAWGYWPDTSDDPATVRRHFHGYRWALASALPPQPVREALDGTEPPPGVWRDLVMQAGGSVVFGEWDPYGFGGLHDLSSEDPARATGERHRLWIRTNGTVVEDLQDDKPGVTWHPPSPRGWRSYGLAQVGTPPTVYDLPALRAYWQILAAPQQGLRPAGFAVDVSVIDFLRVALATDASALEFLRQTWREMIQRNAACAREWDLQGLLTATTARREALDEMQRGEADARSSAALATGISGAVGALSTAALGPVGLIVTGGLKLATETLRRLFDHGDESTACVDVFGRLCPNLERFEMVQSSSDFASALDAPVMRLRSAVDPSTLPPLPLPTGAPAWSMVGLGPLAVTTDGSAPPAPSPAAQRAGLLAALDAPAVVALDPSAPSVDPSTLPARETPHGGPTAGDTSAPRARWAFAAVGLGAVALAVASRSR